MIVIWVKKSSISTGIHCQLYRAKFWYNLKGCSRVFMQLSVGYHNALKKILGVQKSFYLSFLKYCYISINYL